jgi:hypothetical protein
VRLRTGRKIPGRWDSSLSAYTDAKR